MNEVFPGLWIGNSTDARTLIAREKIGGESPLFKPPIKGILNVADDLCDLDNHSRRLVYVHAGLTDGPGNTLEEYLGAIMALQYLIKYRTHVLVHCHEGASRSCFIACAFLSYTLSKPFEEIKAMVEMAHPNLKINQAHMDMYPKIEEWLKIL